MNDKNRQATLAWKSKRTGESGFGEWISKKNALAGCSEAKEKYGDTLHHWVEYREEGNEQK